MPTKRDMLGVLTRDELLAVLDDHGLTVPDRRKKDAIVETLAASRTVKLDHALGSFPRDRLKEMCRGLGLDDSGKEKAGIVERLIGGKAEAPAATQAKASPEPRSQAGSKANGKTTEPLELPPGEKLSIDRLERYLWGAADILRGQIDSSDYKNFIFGLLFLKRLSDRFEEECDALRAEEADPDDPDEHEFFVPKRARWSELQKIPTNIGEALNKACSALEEKNTPLEGVLAGIDWNDERKLGDAKNRDNVLSRLVQHFSRLSLKNSDLSEPDMLGRAYEYLIEKFADDAGKKGGEFYTPRMVVRLIVEILQPKEGMRICDPTCGSGGMLIECAHFLERAKRNPKNLSLFGQEKNLGTWSICKMNMLLHGLPSARIEKGDTIRDPKLLKDGELMLFDRVIANPPYSLKDWGHEIAASDPFGRFRFGIPPRKKEGGDLAFLSHMVAATNTTGMIGVVLPHGVLSRSGSEATIRQGLLDEDLVEAVIGLPTDLFYGAGIPAIVLILNRKKVAERKGKILFVDASTHFGQGAGQNLLRDGDVTRIVAAFRSFTNDPGYSSVVPTDECARRGDMAISGFVRTVPAASTPDLEGTLRAFHGAVAGRQAAYEALLRYLRSVHACHPGSGPQEVFLPEGWRRVVYGDVMTETDERAGTRIDLPVLSVTKRWGPMLASERFGKTMHSRNLSKYRVAPRDHLVADPMLLWDGSIGLQRVVDYGLVSPDYRVYKPGTNVDPEFLGYLVRSPTALPFYKGGARGTNVRRNRIARASFLAIPMLLPPIDEQRRIAATLAALERLAEREQEVLAVLSEAKSTLTGAAAVGSIRIYPESDSEPHES